MHFYFISGMRPAINYNISPVHTIQTNSGSPKVCFNPGYILQCEHNWPGFAPDSTNQSSEMVSTQDEPRSVISKTIVDTNLGWTHVSFCNECAYSQFFWSPKRSFFKVSLRSADRAKVTHKVLLNVEVYEGRKWITPSMNLQIGIQSRLKKTRTVVEDFEGAAVAEENGKTWEKQMLLWIFVCRLIGQAYPQYFSKKLNRLGAKANLH